MSIGTTLFPPANREAAAVAFLRTFWQTVRATGILGGGSAIIVTAADIQHINLVALAYIAGAVIISGILAGGLAAGDILVHGLPAAYQNIPVAQVGAVTGPSQSEPTPVPAPDAVPGI